VTQLSTSRIPGGFTEKTARVNGVTLNYATGGTGPAVVLLHGYPQTWYMWLLGLLGLGSGEFFLEALAP
jgi:pimeloyl-ACP methyl ester carboxylesterase